jgi:Oligosaccharyl transferase STT3, N-terminal
VALALILLLGLALRLDYAWDGREPVFDAVAYGKLSANLQRGEGFTVGDSATQPSSNYSPGLPLLISGIYEVSGGVHERLARLVLAVIGSLAVLFTYLIARRLGGPLAGLVGAGAIAIYPALLEYQGMLMSEPLATTLLSGAVLAMLWAADVGPAISARGSRRGERGGLRARASSPPLSPRHPRERWLVPGLLFGALALTRPEYLGVAIVLALVVLASGFRVDGRIALINAVIMLAGVFLVVGPWTVRNAIALDRFVPISTGGGQVLFAGSYLPSDGDPERVGREVLERHPSLTRELAAEHLPPGGPADLDAVLARVRLEQILAALAAQRYPTLETDRALARMGRQRLWDDITDQPLDYLDFLATKIWRVWGHGPREVMRRPGWEVLHWALLAFALVGLIGLIAERRGEAIPLLTVLVSITAISAILVASSRRGLVLLPLVAALAGAGAVLCRDSLARRWNG